MQVSGWVVLLYGVVVLVGGLIGYLKTDSLASVIMGAIFGITLCGCALATSKGIKKGYCIASGATAILFLFFGYRFFLTYKFMPAGFMCLISAAVLYMLFRKRCGKSC